MKAYFAGQPWEGDRNADDFLHEATEAPTSDARLRIGVAWVKESGLALVEPYFKRVRDAGGRVELVTGLSAGGATKQGLEKALQICDQVHVVYDATGPTFHPKIYFLRDGESSRLLVGSHNLTPGGLFLNIEAGLEVHRETESDDDLFDEVDDWLDDLVADSAMSAPLTRELLAEIVANPRFRIGDESLPTSDADGGNGDRERPPDYGPFARSPRKRRFAKRVSKPSVPAPAPASGEVTDEPPSVVRIWSKKLSRSEALRPNPGSNPTAVLRLGKAGWDIDKETYFREEFFGTLAWALENEAKGKYVCIVEFDCVVDGAPLGVHTVTVDFMARRVADQNNVPTVLHWGTLSPVVRDVDHIGSYVVLRAFSNGTFALEIKSELEAGEAP